MEAKRGDRVSLNILKRQYFFQDGDGGINLTEGSKEMDVIPQNATDYHLAQINHALKSEGLILGYVETKAENVKDDDSDIKELVHMGKNKVEKWVKDLAADKTINKIFKSMKLENLATLEKANKNRPSVIQIIEQQLRYIGGVSRIEEGEQEKLVIKLTAGTEEDAVQQ